MGRKKTGKYEMCLNCSKPIYLPPSYQGKRNKFCNRKCYFEYIRKAIKGSGN